MLLPPFRREVHTEHRGEGSGRIGPPILSSRADFAPDVG